MLLEYLGYTVVTCRKENKKTHSKITSCSRLNWWERTSTSVEIPFHHSAWQQCIFLFPFYLAPMKWNRSTQIQYYLTCWYIENICLTLWDGWGSSGAHRDELTPNKTSGSKRSICALLTVEYQVWNLSQKEDACGQLINKWRIVWLSEGQKGQDGEATFFILYRILFVAKILCIILCWNIANLISFVALNGKDKFI